jgi:hypothetical protein
VKGLAVLERGEQLKTAGHWNPERGPESHWLPPSSIIDRLMTLNFLAFATILFWSWRDGVSG